ncbi:MAG: aldehyde dehydrogenase family protein [Deltaproteobacteria bacterium]|nr:aldehyde dehydrogenase family protein [Deltaproteobacteria bacterium]
MSKVQKLKSTTDAFLKASKSIYGPEISGSHLINGKLKRGENFFQSLNPADLSDVVGSFPSASKKDIDETVKAAAAAYEKWRKVPAPVRGNAIGRLAQVLEREKENLAKIITREIGKTLKESLGEVQEAIDTALFFQSEGRRLYGQTVPSELPQKELMTYRRPLGVCLMITASNFPFAVPSWKIIPALIAGNTVIWKSSQDAPATALSFAMCFQEAGFPAGVVNLIHGDGEVGQTCLEYVEKGLVQKVSFTGSTAVGKKIGEICGRALQIPSLELGGKNPLIIYKDADLDKAIPTSIVSCYGTAGQRCTSTGNIIIHKDIYDEFKSKFMKAASGIKIGNPLLSKNILYGPLIAERYLQNFLKHLEWGKKDGGRLLFGNGRISKKNPYPNFSGDPDAGWFVTPTLWEGVKKDMRLFQEEIFGPTVNLVKVNSFDEAMECANGHDYGLSSAIFTEDAHLMLEFKENIQAGMSSINNSTTGAEAHLPFGGIKGSGNGTRESGIWVLDSYTRWHAVNVDLASQLQLAQMDTDYGDFREPISFKDWVK